MAELEGLEAQCEASRTSLFPRGQHVQRRRRRCINFPAGVRKVKENTKYLR